MTTGFLYWLIIGVSFAVTFAAICQLVCGKLHIIMLPLFTCSLLYMTSFHFLSESALTGKNNISWLYPDSIRLNEETLDSAIWYLTNEDNAIYLEKNCKEPINHFLSSSTLGNAKSIGDCWLSLNHARKMDLKKIYGGLDK